MPELYIKIDTIDKVREFVRITNEIEKDVDLVSGRYVIDAKSIMGIFSVDLTKDLRIRIHAENDNEFAQIKEKLGKFIMESEKSND